ncbi:MAG: hypothetical protein ACTSSA_05810 [Candidatus Freyarchaeota archaeon]
MGWEESEAAIQEMWDAITDIEDQQEGAGGKAELRPKSGGEASPRSP